MRSKGKNRLNENSPVLSEKDATLRKQTHPLENKDLSERDEAVIVDGALEDMEDYFDDNYEDGVVKDEEED